MNEQTNKKKNEHMNGWTDERKDENYIPLGINTGGIITGQLFSQRESIYEISRP